MTVEEDLLRRAQQFDLEALTEIYDSYSPAIFRYALRLLANSELAEECVAETFSRFLGMLRNRQGPRQHLQAYLYRIAHNWVSDQFRRVPPTLPLDSPLRTDGSMTPLEQVLQRGDQERVRYALACLTPDQRQVVVLKFLEDWTNEEIALALGKPVGAVKSLQHRAMGALKRILISEVKTR